MRILVVEDDPKLSSILRDALEKLRLNDSALSFEPENSVALGFGLKLHPELLNCDAIGDFPPKRVHASPHILSLHK